MDRSDFNETLTSLGGFLCLTSFAWWLNFYGPLASGDVGKMLNALPCIALPGSACGTVEPTAGLSAMGQILDAIWVNSPVIIAALFWIGLPLLVFGLVQKSPERSMSASGRYEPRKQASLNQLLDCLNLLMLVLTGLFAPLRLGLAGGGKTELSFADKTWDAMGQTAAQQAAWEKLGHTAETAQPLIASRFDYSFSLPEMIITAIVIIGYFWFVVRYSDKEYRDVIRERFGDR